MSATKFHTHTKTKIGTIMIHKKKN
jgi:hypothetical protein